MELIRTLLIRQLLAALVLAVLGANAPTLVGGLAGESEPEVTESWFGEPVVAPGVSLVRVDRAKAPSEHFVALAESRVDERPVSAMPTPLTPDGRHLWVLSEPESQTVDTLCDNPQRSLGAIALSDQSGQGNDPRVVYPGEHYQPFGLADMHRAPLGQVLITNGCGLPIAIARATDAGDLVDLRTITIDSTTSESVAALHSVRWVNLTNNGPRLDEFPGVPGVVVELLADSGTSTTSTTTTVVIETGTGTVRSLSTSVSDESVWLLDYRFRQYLYQGSGEVRVEAIQLRDPRVVASWDHPVRGVASMGGDHAVFGEDGLIVVDFFRPLASPDSPHFFEQVVTSDPVLDAGWTPGSDALVWAGPDGTSIMVRDGSVLKLSNSPASSIDISGDGTTIVAAESDGYRVFTWQPIEEPTGSDQVDTFTVLSADGFGPLRIGNNLDEARSLLGDTLSYRVEEAAHLGGCGHYALFDDDGKNLVVGVYETTSQGPIVRSIVASRNPNDFGVRYGAPPSAIVERYGAKVEVVPRKHSYDLHHLIELPGSAEIGVMFVSDPQTVHEVRVGTQPWIQIDYCDGP